MRGAGARLAAAHHRRLYNSRAGSADGSASDRVFSSQCTLVTASSDSAPDSIPDPSLSEYRALASRGLADALGIEVVELTPDRVVATMPVDQRTRQPFGVLHGGASLALIETAASLGAWRSIDRARFTAVGIEINANHLRAKAEGVVRVVATPLHRGRTTQVWAAEIRDEAERLVCAGRCTLAIVPLAVSI